MIHPTQPCPPALKPVFSALLAGMPAPEAPEPHYLCFALLNSAPGTPWATILAARDFLQAALDGNFAFGGWLEDHDPAYAAKMHMYNAAEAARYENARRRAWLEYLTA